jgi:hypothetical protein
MKHLRLAAVAASVLVANAAHAGPTIDGTLTPIEYAGALVTNVQFQQGTDPGNQFPSSPGTYVENVGYTVYYTSDASNVYVGLQSNSASGLTFANLYFDTNNATSAGSDIAFEVTNNRLFVPATGIFSLSSIQALGGSYAATAGTGAVGDVIEFAIPWTVFTTNASGLGQPLVAPGGALQLRTSQSFNYAAVTGDGTAGDVIPRFGFQFAPAATGAVPEPATWAMMIVGFGMMGASMRRRQPARVRFA